MAQLIELPAQLHCGDTLTRTVCEYGYPASGGWRVELTISDSAASHTITSTANGDSHALAITTGVLGAGNYSWGLVFTNGADRVTLQTGLLKLLPNFSDGAADRRSHCEKVLQAIETLLEGKVGSDKAKLTVDGQALERYPIPDLLAMRNKYRRELNQLIRRQKGWRPNPRTTFRM
ncbi:hypothetical protein ACJJID_00215 (plasmid) [Microbulbifer sp. CnH-101-G]|uniref:hypothetical protein n=1 Tax=Microbulbifer sp. CnH-101-G TaxID=3243393 RepID=UPI0040392922